jgi:hypothetical protein
VQVGSVKVCLGQFRSIQMCLSKHRPVEISSVQVCSMQVRLGENRLGQNRFGKICTVQVNPRKVSPGQLFPGQVGSVEIPLPSRKTPLKVRSVHKLPSSEERGDNVNPPSFCAGNARKVCGGAFMER